MLRLDLVMQVDQFLRTPEVVVGCLFSLYSGGWLAICFQVFVDGYEGEGVGVVLGLFSSWSR